MSVTFNYRLKQSQSRETEFATRLEQIGYTCTTTQDQHEFASYDVSAYNPVKHITTTFEVKQDNRAATTNRVAVEVYKYTKEGKRTPSGITATQSQYMVYCFNDSTFYVIQTLVLWEMILNREYIRIVSGGDESRTVMTLFDIGYFKSRCLVL